MVESNENSLSNYEDEFNDVSWEKHYCLSHAKTPSFLQPVPLWIRWNNFSRLQTRSFQQENISMWSDNSVYSKNSILTPLDKDENAEISMQIQNTNDNEEPDKMTNESLDENTIKFSGDPQSFLRAIENAYNYASTKLLKLLVEDKQLICYLRYFTPNQKINPPSSIKHYFMLDKGDFYVLFMENASEELEKHANGKPPQTILMPLEMLKTKLDSYLEIALSASICLNDPFKEDLE